MQEHPPTVGTVLIDVSKVKNVFRHEGFLLVFDTCDRPWRLAKANTYEDPRRTPDEKKKNLPTRNGATS